MKKGIFIMCLAVFGLAFTACDGFFPAVSKPSVPDDHTKSIKGVFHKEDPEHPFYESSGCTDSDCHKDDLDGGVALYEGVQHVIPSCFQCHETLWEDDTEPDETAVQLYQAIIK